MFHVFPVLAVKNDFYFYCRLLETRRIAWSLPVGVYPLKENGFLDVPVRIRITRRYQFLPRRVSRQIEKSLFVSFKSPEPPCEA